MARLLQERAPQRLKFDEITAALVRSGYRFTDNALKRALAEFRMPHAVDRPPPIVAPVRPSGIAVDVAMALHRYEVDAVEVDRQSVLGSGRVRIDKVADQQTPYWLSRWAATPDQLPPPPSQPWMTLTQWKLPLVPITDVSQLPAVAVLKFQDAKTAADGAQTVLQGGDPSPGRYQVVVEECDAVEAERRLSARGLLARRHGTSNRSGAKRIAEGACLKCGLPLSDPDSVKVGIGPECRRKLGDDVIHALRNPSPQRRDLIGAKQPKRWAEMIRQRYMSSGDATL